MSSWMKTFTLLIALCAGTLASAAAPIWTFKQGGKMEAEFLDFIGTNSVILLRVADAKNYTVNISDLSVESLALLTDFRAQPIRSAFGMILGQTFSPGSAIEKRSGPESAGHAASTSYRFRPTSPIADFSDYWVNITPLSHRVYKVGIMGRFELNKALDVEEKLLVLIEEKYGRKMTREHLDFHEAGSAETLTLKIGKRQIVLVHSLGRDVGLTSVSLWYSDEALAKQAEQELEGKSHDIFKSKL